jgi:hypothetical protein
MKNRRAIVSLLALFSPIILFAQSYVTEIGRTLYDLQTNATIGARVVADDFGISAVWTQGFNPTTFPDRGTGYNHWDPETSSWSTIPSSRVESYRSGWPSLIHTSNGVEWLFAHDGTGIRMVGRDMSINGPWQELGYVPSTVSEPVLWCRTAAGGLDGNSIHMVASTPINGAYIDGLDQQMLYYRSQDGGLTWDITDMTFEGLASPIFGFDSDTYAMSASGNTVAVACFGSLQDSYVWISNDNGNTWTRHIFHDFPIDNYVIDSGTDVDGDGIEDRITSTSTSGSVAVDDNGVVHVSYATMDYIDAPFVYDGQYNFYPASGEIRYWNSASSGNPLDVSDDLNVSAGIAPNIIGDVNINWSQMGAYGFGGLVNHPNVVLNDNGDILLLYDAIKEGTMENGVFRRHLFMVKSIDGGFTWSEPVDVSPNVDGVNWEYNYACAAPSVYDGKVHMTAQRDLVPGFSTNAASAADFNMNSIVYVAIDAENLAPIINGCTDPLACNFSAEATVDDGSCIVTPTEEICDGIDNDCNGEIDNGVLPTWYQDSDTDGFGSAANGIWIGCEAIAGYVLDNSDCDDFAVTYQDIDLDGFGGDNTTGCGVYNSNDCNDLFDFIGSGSFYVPDADMDGYASFVGYYFGCSADPGFILYNGSPLQEDCNDNDASIGGVNYYDYDNDGDGFGDYNNSYIGCFAQPGYIAYQAGISQPDCNDYALIYSDLDGDGFGSDELVACGGVYNTEDCSDDQLNYQDVDMDGVGSNILIPCGGSPVNTDCDDYNANSPTNALMYYYDYDGDGFGYEYDYYFGCDQIAGFVLNALDCNPWDVTYLDNDGDGYGSTSIAACGVLNTADCDDNDPMIFGTSVYVMDNDGDGFGNFMLSYTGCPTPGYILYTGPGQQDCNDYNDQILGSDIYLMDYDGDGFGSFFDYTFSCQEVPGAILFTGDNNQQDCDESNFTYADNDGDGFGSDDLVGCGGSYNSDDCDDNQLNFADLDGDGAGSTVMLPCGGSLNNTDCDDNDPLSLTQAMTYYYDADNDGFGWYMDFITTCSPPSYYVANADDCFPYDLTYQDLDGDNFGSQVYAPCGVVINSDCDDNDAALTNGLLFIADADADGYGNFSDAYFGCFAESGYIALTGDELQEDCNDNDAVVLGVNYYIYDIDGDGFGNYNNYYLGCSQNAGYILYQDGISQPDCNDNMLLYADNDGDGFGSAVLAGCGVTNSLDCDDNNITYIDQDGDSYGSSQVAPCGATNMADCDDSNPNLSPGMSEICNQSDDNCDGNADEGIMYDVFMDMDGDGYGDVSMGMMVCANVPGFVTDNTDCDDANGAVSPMQTEVCNLIDDDCDIEVDEFVQTEYFADNDSDGYGDANNSSFACETPAGFVGNNDDCDDQMLTYEDMDGDGFGGISIAACGVISADDCDDMNAGVNPVASEICNYLDDNCNGESDEFVQNVYYADADADGFGDAQEVAFDCSVPVGFVNNSDDCDDLTWSYADGDLDGFGIELLVACGGATQAGDCDDNNSSISPAQTEICNEIDDNCDDEVDEFVQNVYYADADGDGFGDPNATDYACQTPMGFVDNMDDCDDTQITFIDADTDGYGGDIIDPCGIALTGDCDDANNLINPGVDEIEGNQVDENCDGELVGIAELNQDLIAVYPNPSQGELNIKMANGSLFQWQLYDAKGAMVESGMSVADQVHYEQLGQLNSGMYRLVIKTQDHQVYNWNWMIQH